MAQKYYDEFSRLPIDKMAQQITDMTFKYKETQVPKVHYKKILSTSIEEVIESSVEVNLIDTYYRTLEQLYKNNPKWLFEALLCLDTGTKPSTMSNAEYQAVELTWSEFSKNKNAKTVDHQWLEDFKQIKTFGGTYKLGGE